MDAVAVIGLGKLGGCFAVQCAASGIQTIGVDVDQARVDALNQAWAPVEEPGLPELLEQACGRLSATTSYDDAVRGSEAAFVFVPTPSAADGTFELTLVLQAIASLGQALRAQRRTSEYLVVISSTVMPGATRGPIRRALEGVSGMRVGEELRLCYSPHFVALGSVLRAPSFHLIGADDQASRVALEACYAPFSGTVPVHCTSTVNAELVKLSVNTLMATQITYANLIGALCEQLPGADATEVLRIAAQDSHTQPRYQPGTSFGGPCLPRDLRALGAIAPPWWRVLPDALSSVNEAGIDDLHWRAILADDKKRIAMLGLTYKAGIPVFDGAPGLLLANMLGKRAVVYEPLGVPRALSPEASVASSAREAVANAGVAILATCLDEVMDLRPADFPDGCTVFDPWRRLWALSESPHIHYVPGGIGP